MSSTRHRATFPARISAYCAALYALNIYLPASSLARSFRRVSRKLRGRDVGLSTKLPTAHWSELLPRSPISLVETDRADGNVNLAELAILAQAAAWTIPGTQIVEIGTFDGRTTLNLAVNAAPDIQIFTLDLPPGQATQFELARGEGRYVDKPQSAARLRVADPEWPDVKRRIVQLYGDSASYDWSPHRGRAGLVFVDGSHSYDYVLKDSDTAFRLATEEGVVLWHDYGVWEGVTRALDELEARQHLGLRHIRGTSLVFWRAANRKRV